MIPDPDELYVLRSKFYSGNYSSALEEALSVSADSPFLAVYRDCLAMRADLALGRLDKVLAKAETEHEPALKAVGILAKMKQKESDVARTTEKLEKMGAKLESGSEEMNALTRAMIALCFLEAKNWKGALKMCHRSESLEELSISALALLQINRLDLAKREVQKMAEVDDDDTLTQISKVWVYLSSPEWNDDIYQEIHAALNEQLDKYGKSPMLLHLLGVLELRASKFNDALNLLKESRSLSLSRGEKVLEATLESSLSCINLIDPDSPTYNAILSELNELYPGNEFSSKSAELAKSFDQASANFSM